MLKLLLAKFKESFFSVVPIIILVLILSFSIAKLPIWSLVLFLVSAAVMILGITLFNLGVDMSMIPIGEKVGSSLVKTKNLPLIVILTFVIGVFISVAEPDLIVLAKQINGVPDYLIILIVSLGVGIALIAAFLRILFQLPLSLVLITCYIAAFILSAFTSGDFVSIAWESGAVTTGPIMVPFVIALGLGLSMIRGDKTTEEDSFGLISLCLIGPIISVLILGMFYAPSGGSAINVPSIASVKDIWLLYLNAMPEYLGQIAIALLPIVLLFILFQIAKLRLRLRPLLRIGIGTVYTFFGLVLFLISANIGFMPSGFLLGSSLVLSVNEWLLVPVGMIMGFFVVAAEPAVFVLKRQVEEVTSGAISAKSMGLGLSIGVGISVGLSMLRVVTGVSLLYFIVPGYIIALILTFIVPRLFTSIAFDSGAVASGPLAATFMLPFAIGACEVTGGNVFADAFGIVALVAMTPVITLQLFGLNYIIKSKIAQKKAVIPHEEKIIELDYDIDEADFNENEDIADNVNVNAVQDSLIDKEGEKYE